MPYCQTKAELVRVIGVSKSTILRHLNRANAPKRTKAGWDVEAVKQHLQANAKADVREKMSPETKKLRDAKLEEQIRALRIWNDSQEAQFVSRAKLSSALAAITKQADEIAERRLYNEWPEVVGSLDVAGARIFGRRLKDLLMTDIRGLAPLLNF